jgi:hypothetical protein
MLSRTFVCTTFAMIDMVVGPFHVDTKTCCKRIVQSDKSTLPNGSMEERWYRIQFTGIRYCKLRHRIDMPPLCIRPLPVRDMLQSLNNIFNKGNEVQQRIAGDLFNRALSVGAILVGRHVYISTCYSKAIR